MLSFVGFVSEKQICNGLCSSHQEANYTYCVSILNGNFHSSFVVYLGRSTFENKIWKP